MGYFVTPTPKGYRLRWKKDGGKAGTSWRSVSLGSPEARDLGLSPSLTFEQAQEQLRRLRAANRLRERAERRARIAARLEEEELIVSAYLPPDVVAAFESSQLADAGVPARHWRLARQAVAAVAVHPAEWYARAAAFWRWAEASELSPDYVCRVLRVVRMYGLFYCQKTNSPPVALPALPRKILNKIKAAYLGARGGAAKTNAMAEAEMLAAAKKAPPKKANYLRLLFYFGLRPDEARQVVKEPQGALWQVVTGDPRFPWALRVYMPKMAKRGEDHVWKVIPAARPEQQALRPALEARELAIPGYQYTRKLFAGSGRRLTRRSARKGFSLWLKELGYSAEARRAWLGHKPPKELEQSYDDTRVVVWEEIKRKAG